MTLGSRTECCKEFWRVLLMLYDTQDYRLFRFVYHLIFYKKKCFWHESISVLIWEGSKTLVHLGLLKWKSISLYVPGIRVCQWQTISKFAVNQTKLADTSSEDQMSVPYKNTFLPLMPSLEGKWNAQMTIPEISKNSLPDATELWSKLLTFLPIRTIHLGEVSKLGWFTGCQIHSVGTFLLFPVPAVSVNLQHSDIIPT